MPELTDFEYEQLTQRGPCETHTHEIDLAEHRNLETLQSIEAVKNVTANYTVTFLDDIIVVDSTTGNVTITLPKSRGGRKFCVIKAVAANTVIVNFSGETMLGLSSVSLTDQAARLWFKAVAGGYIPL